MIDQRPYIAGAMCVMVVELVPPYRKLKPGLARGRGEREGVKEWVRSAGTAEARRLGGPDGWYINP